MGRLLDAAVAFFSADERELSVMAAKNPPQVHFMVTAEHTRIECALEAYEDTERVCLLATYPALVPEPKRLAAAEYITRANFGILLGNFELDMDIGLVRFKTSADVESIELTPTFLKNLFEANLTTATKYYPGLMKVIYANMKPSDALAVVRQVT
ncbi:MAG: hypothetical protein EP329_22555 [Deltaproteobacteria bacterium]|nr:MAG: hypothetical protein EP329_22555 [Deltaproteobacteria bacterium]